MDVHHKDLESLKERISHEESYLQEDVPEHDNPGGDNQLDQGAEEEVPLIPRADDTTSESAMAPVSDPTPSEDLAMEVDKGAVGPPPTSPVSREDDSLLNDNDAVGVEADLAHLTVSSPSGQDGEGEEASNAGVPPPLEDA